MRIFEDISTLISKDQFSDAQKTFFFKYKDTFTDEEENKLEYT